MILLNLLYLLLYSLRVLYYCIAAALNWWYGTVLDYDSEINFSGWKNFSTDYSVCANALFYYNMYTRLPTGQTVLQVISSLYIYYLDMIMVVSIYYYDYGSSVDCYMWPHELSSARAISSGLGIVVDSEPIYLVA